MKYFEKAVISSQEEIAPGIYSLWLENQHIAGAAVPGQFVSVYCNDGGRLLPRPLSICETDTYLGRFRLVYRAAGLGTSEFSGMHKGGVLDVMGPLGNGFPLDKGYRRALLVGGGIGVPPMVMLSAGLPGEKYVVSGYRDSNLFLTRELKRNAKLFIATDDGSIGTKGNVVDAIKENSLKADAVFACGPAPMLRAVKEYASFMKMDCFVSLEERMACGVGACLACVCGSADTDPHTNVKNKRICKDGPVFAADEIDL